MFNNLPGIGLDIGDDKIRFAWLKRRGQGFQLFKYGSINTPSGAVDAGIIYEPERLGQEIQVLVRDFKLKGKKVVTAVTGQQVYIRNLVMPHMNIKELKEAVYYKAINFLPIPVEESAMDIFPLREFEDDEGRKTEIFFTAARRQQVANIDIACRIAGLKLAVVEIEPLAIFRAVIGAIGTVTAILKLDPCCSYLAVFKGRNLVFYKPLPSGSSAIGQIINTDGSITPGITNKVKASQDNQYDSKLWNITSEIKRAVEYYQIQIDTGDIDRFLICGAGSAIGGLQLRLTAALGYPVENGDLLPDIVLPPHISESNQIYELKQEFIAALGLAAREVI
ncbi:MAG: type IV pilus assembly protein PilM [Syntrophomonas sp.]|nr:type IV pilus assembly protein PilM [Syntrophomonas sp.]